jgi:hypothetical protein
LAAGDAPDRRALTIVTDAMRQYGQRQFPDADVDDLVQASLVDLVMSRAEPPNALAYLLAATRNAGINAQRIQGREAALRPTTDLEDHPASYRLDRLLEHMATAEELERALRVLVDTDDSLTVRIIVTWLELAEELGRPPSIRELATDAGVSDTLVASALDTFRRALVAPDEMRRAARSLADPELRIPAILGPDGTPLVEGSPARYELEIRIAEISEELIARLAAEPELLYKLAPRRFEEVVAELYHRRGFEARLTPSTGDAGIDVYVVRHDELGTSLSVVQCKRYSPSHKVGPGLVRELQGSVLGAGAATGVLLTTSFFTRGARALEQRFRYQLSLQDYYALQELLRLAPREVSEP